MQDVSNNSSFKRIQVPPKSFENTNNRKKHERNVRHIQSNKNGWISTENFNSVFAITVIVCLIFGVFIAPVGANIMKKPEGPLHFASLPSTKSGNKIKCNNPQFYAQVPSSLQPYDSQPKPLFGKNYCPKAIEKFHPAISKVIHAGKMEGLTRVLCVIPEKMPSFEECKEVAKMIDGLTKERFPKEYKKAMTDLNSEKGLPIHSPEELDFGFTSVYIGLNPRRVTNYYDALRYLEGTVLKNPGFLEKSDNDIVASIMKTNQIIERNLSPVAGKFRKEVAIILDDNTDGIAGMKKLLIKNGGTDKDIAIFNEMFSKKMEKVTAEQSRVLSKICYLPTSPENIKGEMLILAREIKDFGVKMVNGEIAPVTLAAYVHQEIGRIHPTEDGNGRTARAWTNVILQLGGEKAIIFPSEEAYTAAIVEDQAYPGAFADYLVKVIEWNRLQAPLQGIV